MDIVTTSAAVSKNLTSADIVSSKNTIGDKAHPDSPKRHFGSWAYREVSSSPVENVIVDDSTIKVKHDLFEDYRGNIDDPNRTYFSKLVFPLKLLTVSS